MKLKNKPPFNFTQKQAPEGSSTRLDGTVGPTCSCQREGFAVALSAALSSPN
jgi:hypothetical protein